MEKTVRSDGGTLNVQRLKKSLKGNGFVDFAMAIIKKS
jgi:hypothetical protein